MREFYFSSDKIEITSIRFKFSLSDVVAHPRHWHCVLRIPLRLSHYRCTIIQAL